MPEGTTSLRHCIDGFPAIARAYVSSRSHVRSVRSRAWAGPSWGMWSSTFRAESLVGMRTKRIAARSASVNAPSTAARDHRSFGRLAGGRGRCPRVEG